MAVLFTDESGSKTTAFRRRRPQRVNLACLSDDSLSNRINRASLATRLTRPLHISGKHWFFSTHLIPWFLLRLELEYQPGPHHTPYAPEEFDHFRDLAVVLSALRSESIVLHV